MINDNDIVKIKYSLTMNSDEKKHVGEFVCEVKINGEDDNSKIFKNFLNTIKDEDNIMGKKEKIIVDGRKVFPAPKDIKLIKVPIEKVDKKEIFMGQILNINVNEVEIPCFIIGITEEGVMLKAGHPFSESFLEIELEVVGFNSI